MSEQEELKIYWSYRVAEEFVQNNKKQLSQLLKKKKKSLNQESTQRFDINNYFLLEFFFSGKTQKFIEKFEKTLLQDIQDESKREFDADTYFGLLNLITLCSMTPRKNVELYFQRSELVVQEFFKRELRFSKTDFPLFKIFLSSCSFYFNQNKCIELLGQYQHIEKLKQIQKSISKNESSLLHYTLYNTVTNGGLSQGYYFSDWKNFSASEFDIIIIMVGILCDFCLEEF